MRLRPKEKRIFVEVIAQKEGVFTMESGKLLMSQILEQTKEVDGVFCATDHIAIGAMEAIKEAGYLIPDHITLVGMGGNRIGEVVTPKLTTVQYAYEASGDEAATILLALMNGDKQIDKRVKLSYHVVARETTRKE